MNKLSSWLFIIIALIMLLPLVGVDQLGSAGPWIILIAFALVGIIELVKG